MFLCKILIPTSLPMIKRIRIKNVPDYGAEKQSLKEAYHYEYLALPIRSEV